MPSYEYERRDNFRRLVHYDPANPSKFHTELQQRVDLIIDQNRALEDEQRPGSTNKLLARVPISVFERSVHENWGDDDWKRFLNDPANKHLRVWKGRV